MGERTDCLLEKLKPLLNNQTSVEQVLTLVVNLIPKIYDRTGGISVRLRFDNVEYFSKDFKKSDFNQNRKVSVMDQERGFLEVHDNNHRENETFPSENRLIRIRINLIAACLSRLITKMEDALSRVNDAGESIAQITPCAFSGPCHLLFDEMFEDKKLIEQYHESVDLYKTILTSISDSVIITRSDGTLTFVCPNVEILFGFNDVEFFDFDDIYKLLKIEKINVESLRTAGEISNIEADIIDKQGRLHNVLINVKKVNIGDGTMLFSIHDVTEKKEISRNLDFLNKTLIQERQVLENKNITLREVLNHIENEKQSRSLKLHAQIERNLFPVLRKLEISLPEKNRKYINHIRDMLLEMILPEAAPMNRISDKLSPREYEICKLIREGMTSKEIASTLNISEHTIRKQRYNIRRKLNISGEKVNLQAALTKY